MFDRTGKGFADRLETATQARQKLVERFQSRAMADDPALAERRAARQALSAAREQRLARRKAERTTEAKQAAAAAEQTAAEKAEQDAALAKAQKVARDARYAARKARR